MNSTTRTGRFHIVFLFWLAVSVWGGEAREVNPVNKLLAEVLQKDAANPMSEKESRTAAQRKLDSHIVLALKKSRGEPPFDRPTSLDPDLKIAADGRVLADLHAQVSRPLLALIEATGGQVVNSFEAAHSIRAWVPLTQMEALASRSDVQFISPAAEATTNNSGAPSGGSSKP
jgi:hypothetical protein